MTIQRQDKIQEFNSFKDMLLNPVGLIVFYFQWLSSPKKHILRWNFEESLLPAVLICHSLYFLVYFVNPSSGVDMPKIVFIIAPVAFFVPLLLLSILIYIVLYLSGHKHSFYTTLSITYYFVYLSLPLVALSLTTPGIFILEALKGILLALVAYLFMATRPNRSH